MRSRPRSASGWPSADPGARVVSFLGDGTFLMAPTELVTAAAGGPGGHPRRPRQPRLPGHSPAADAAQRPRVRQRVPLPAPPRWSWPAGEVTKAPRLEGDYLRLDLVQVAAGLGARARRATTAAELRAALADTRGHPGPVVIVVPVIPHADLPGAGVWWDVAPAEVSATDGHRRPARRVRSRPGQASGGSVERRRQQAPNHSPLNHGALAAAVRSGTATLGTFIGGASPVAAEVCAAAGVDWVLLDLEHGAGGEEQVRDVVPAAGSYGVPTVVRVESAARIRMGRVLDAGAAGIMLPRMNTVDEVAEAVLHLRYPPAGDRGVATYNRACRFGLDPGALDRANAEVLGVVQIESATAVGNAEAIAALDGVDVLFVGPRDLSHDLGVPGDLTAPAFTEALERVLAAGRKHGKACGLLVNDGAAAAQRLEQGWSFVGIGSDSTLLAAAVTAEFGRARTPSRRTEEHRDENDRRRIRPARHRPDQRGLDGQAAQPRLPGHPAGLPRTEDPAPVRARGRHRRRPGRLCPRGPRLRPGQHRLPGRAGRPRRRRGVHLRAEHAAPRDRRRGRPGRQAVLDREAGRPGRRRDRRGRRRGPRGRPGHLDRLQLPARTRGGTGPRADRGRRLGRITNVRAVFFNSYAAEPNGALSWRFRRDQAGSGALGDLLSHVVDLMQYVVAPITEVSSLLSTVHAAAAHPADGIGHPLRRDRGRRAGRGRERRLRRGPGPVRRRFARRPARSAPWRHPGSASARSAGSASRSTAPRARRSGTSSR